MADSTTYHRFVLTLNSPWNLGTATNHNWHVKFSVSGTIDMGQADAETTALDLWTPIQEMTSSKTSLIEWSYYPSGTNVASQIGVYTPGTHVGTDAAYSTGGVAQQLEVCALARCPVGTNTRGKEVYLRKWIHDVQCSGANANALQNMTSPASVIAKWNTGSGPHAVVPVSPTTGKQGGPWTIETHAFTHQLRRGPRRKKVTTAGGGTPLDIIERLAALGLAGPVGSALADLLSKVP